MRIILLFVVGFITSVTLAGTREGSVPDSRYTEYGEKHECVVEIKGKYPKEREDHPGREFCASAVAIKPNWVLTAAHVVKGTEDVFVLVKGKKHKVEKVIVKKEFEEEKIGSNDIALCYCPDDLGLDFYPELYSGNDEVGKVASICGFGMTGTFGAGATKWDGKKRAGSNVVERVEWNCLVCVTTDKRTELEFLIASGDSGGGLFLDGKLAGINSFVMTTDGSSNSDYGDEGVHTRISDYIGWINEESN